MADNTTLPGTGDVIASDDVAGVKYQRVKLVNGTLDATDAIGGDAANGLDVDVTRLPALVAGTAYVGKVRLTDGTNDVTLEQPSNDGEATTEWVLPVENYNMMWNTTSWDRVRGDTTNGLWTNIKSSVTLTVNAHAVTNAGAFVVQDSEKFADSGAFTQGASKILPAGFIVDDTSTDLLSENDVGAARLTTNRIQLFYTGEPPSADIYGGGTKTDTTAQDIMAAAASLYNYLCFFSIYNASSTNTYAILKDGATTKMVIPLAAFGGAVFNFPRPLRCSAANAAWTLGSGASVTTAHYYGGGFRAAI